MYTCIKRFIFSPFSENTYLIYDETLEVVVVDPGCLLQKEKNALAEFIKDRKLLLKAILQTHTHLDHVFGTAFLKRNFGVKMYMHQADVPVLEDVENRCKLWGIPGYEPVSSDGFLDEGDVFEFGNTKLDVLWVPGHSPGHIAFVNHQDGYIVGGDCLFKGSIGRTDFPLCSHEKLIDSIKNKFFTLPDDYIVYAGHMEQTTIGHEKRHNPFFNK